MTVALGLLLATLLVGAFGPVYLRATVTPRVRPGFALAAWVSTLLLLVVSGLGAAIALALPRGTGLDGLFGMATSCINIVRPGGEVIWAHVARLGGAALLFGLTAWVGLVWVWLALRHRRWRRAHLRLLHTVCQRDNAIWWLADDLPVAYSVGGRPGQVIATAGLTRLPPDERAAILAHEYAHLRGRHHLLVLAARAMAVALPFVPFCRQAPAAISVLVELAADAVAAREHGAAPVRSGLLAVSARGAPRSALAMSRDAVDARLRWLDGRQGGLGRLPAKFDHALATVLSCAPIAVALGAAISVVLAYCLAIGAG
ncbi:peptidase M48-like protein [Tamaricihabitans halophyticus]|uniref:Peptidase M48-like protein n=1 Tax=Tamaricihabitans halophyticus TaxID=1262583 RepID=A0A4V2STE4_9PSEU|nr:M56 family metallopeptidase [Tamaricihabitans halophyticus]TCP50006.1 peptidase M48-like protein [Tamaricihabitans halophyticus]